MGTRHPWPTPPPPPTEYLWLLDANWGVIKGLRLKDADLPSPVSDSLISAGNQLQLSLKDWAQMIATFFSS